MSNAKRARVTTTSFVAKFGTPGFLVAVSASVSSSSSLVLPSTSNNQPNGTGISSSSSTTTTTTPNASILATADAELHALSWLAIGDVGAYALTCRAAAALAIAYWCGADELEFMHPTDPEGSGAAVCSFELRLALHMARLHCRSLRRLTIEPNERCGECASRLAAAVGAAVRDEKSPDGKCKQDGAEATGAASPTAAKAADDAAKSGDDDRLRALVHEIVERNSATLRAVDTGDSHAWPSLALAVATQCRGLQTYLQPAHRPALSGKLDRAARHDLTQFMTLYHDALVRQSAETLVECTLATRFAPDNEQHVHSSDDSIERLLRACVNLKELTVYGAHLGTLRSIRSAALVTLTLDIFSDEPRRVTTLADDPVWRYDLVCDELARIFRDAPHLTDLGLTFGDRRQFLLDPPDDVAAAAAAADVVPEMRASDLEEAARSMVRRLVVVSLQSIVAMTVAGLLAGAPQGTGGGGGGGDSDSRVERSDGGGGEGAAPLPLVADERDGATANVTSSVAESRTPSTAGRDGETPEGTGDSNGGGNTSSDRDDDTQIDASPVARRSERVWHLPQLEKLRISFGAAFVRAGADDDDDDDGGAFPRTDACRAELPRLEAPRLRSLAASGVLPRCLAPVLRQRSTTLESFSCQSVRRLPQAAGPGERWRLSDEDRAEQMQMFGGDRVNRRIRLLRLEGFLLCDSVVRRALFSAVWPWLDSVELHLARAADVVACLLLILSRAPRVRSCSLLAPIVRRTTPSSPFVSTLLSSLAPLPSSSSSSSSSSSPSPAAPTSDVVVAVYPRLAWLRIARTDDELWRRVRLPNLHTLRQTEPLSGDIALILRACPRLGSLTVNAGPLATCSIADDAHEFVASVGDGGDPAAPGSDGGAGADVAAAAAAPIVADPRRRSHESDSETKRVARCDADDGDATDSDDDAHSADERESRADGSDQSFLLHVGKCSLPLLGNVLTHLPHLVAIHAHRRMPSHFAILMAAYASLVPRLASITFVGCVPFDYRDDGDDGRDETERGTGDINDYPYGNDRHYVETAQDDAKNVPLDVTATVDMVRRLPALTYLHFSPLHVARQVRAAHDEIRRVSGDRVGMANIPRKS